MTPYVVNDEDGHDDSVAQKPKSIMVANGTGENHVNGDTPPKSSGDLVETPDSLPSRSSASSRSIIGNGKNGKSGALKRVSFGSSKGSMVETLVYEHQEDLPDASTPFATPPLLNGEDSRLHPSKVRVKFFESQQVAQVACTPPSPDVTLDFEDSMASPTSDQSTAYARQMSVESGVDNPFRPDGELSKEADTIVSLIKEGKPITPVKGEADLQAITVTENALAPNGLHSPVTPDQMDSPSAGVVSGSPAKPEVATKPLEKTNGSAPKSNASPGVVDVQHGVIAPPSDTPQVEQVTIKKKPKCKCCVIQ